MKREMNFQFFRQELRYFYQRYFSLGLIYSVSIHALLIGIYFLVIELTKEDDKVFTVRILKYSDLGPPPSLANENTAQPVAVAPAAALPSVAIPIPVPDEQAPPEQTIATQTEMANVNPVGTGTGTGDSISVSGGPVEIPKEIQEEDPDPGAYVPVEKDPEAVQMKQPTYPELAIRAGLEGTVYVKVLVNKSGRVEKAIMVKNDGMNVFDEPALAAAKQWVFTPAIMNGHPVKVWVVVPLKFRLK